MEDENLTEEEERIEEDAGVDGEEAHRIGEFDDLRNRMERMEAMQSEIAASIEAGFAGIRDLVVSMAVEGGAVIREEPDASSVDAVVIDGSFDSMTPLDDLDLEFD